MASFRGIRIEGNVIVRDDSVTEEVWFEESILREVTEIGVFCFGLGPEVLGEFGGEEATSKFRSFNSSRGPSVLDLSLLVNCTEIGEYFAVGHYGPIAFPPALTTVGDAFMVGAKCRVLELPASVESIGHGLFMCVTADKLVIPPLVTSLPGECFSGSCIATLEIPGSVTAIGTDFCGNATIGALTFAESTSDECDSLFEGTFLADATVQTLDLKRDLRLLSNGNWVIAASAKIACLRHTLPAWLWDPTTDAATLSNEPYSHAVIRAVFLGNPHNARLFPNSVVTVDEQVAPTVDPTISRAAPRPPSVEGDSSDEVDPATLEVFEDKHRSLVMDGDTIDMSGLVKCEVLGDGCFARVTGITTLLLPPSLKKIGDSFMEGADVPDLDIVFPRSLRQVGNEALVDATVRSVDFAACDDLTGLGNVLVRATVSNFAFPGSTSTSSTPVLKNVGPDFMKGVNAPTLDLVFPEVREFGKSVLSGAKLRSVQFCDSRGRLDTVLHLATVEAIVFPPTLSTIGADFMSGANSPQLDLVFPPFFSVWGIPEFRGVTVRSLDFSACHQLRDIGTHHLSGAKFETYRLPPNVATIGYNFMSGAVSPNLDLVFPSSLATVRLRMLNNAKVRSVDFSNCSALESVEQNLLQEATVQSVLLPPNLRLLTKSALSGIRGELSITFPKSLQDIEDDVLSSAKVTSVDMSAAKSVSRIPPGFCSQATVTDTFTLPPAVASFGNGAFSDIKCAQFRFDASPSLEVIEADVFRGAKITTVSITDSPKLETVGDNFLSGATLETPASLVLTDRLKAVGKSFCAGTTLQCLDMKLCEKIVTLPDNFLFKAHCGTGTGVGADAEEVREEAVSLPPTVTTVGDGCFASSKGIHSVGGASVQSSLAIGNDFACGSDMESIPWTCRRVTVGHSFCKDVKALEVMDADCFHSVGDDFCRGIGKLTVDFSLSGVGTLGAGFLQGTTFSPATTAVDLSGCTFTECPERFLYQAHFERGGKVTLPSTVASIGAQCCAEVIQLEDLRVVSSTTSASPPPCETTTL